MGIKIIMSAILSLLMKIGKSMITDAFLEWAFFWIAERLVESTETSHDNQWLDQIRKSYEDVQRKDP